jgi:hypothetical protein
VDPVAGLQHFQHSLFFQHDAGSFSLGNYAGKFAHGACVQVKPEFADGPDMSSGGHRILRDRFFIQHGAITFIAME